MSTFAERIKVLCKQKGITVKQAEIDCGLANGYIGTTSRQGSIPRSDRLDRIAEYFNVSREYLLGEVETQKEQPSLGVRIPLYDRVAAGLPISATDNIVGQEEISKTLAAKGEYFALRIKGDSMSPYIMDKDVVICQRQNDAESGDIVIVLINGSDGVCKRLRKNSNGITLVSLNQVYEPMVFTHAEIDTQPVRILGKVVEIRREI